MTPLEENIYKYPTFRHSVTYVEGGISDEGGIVDDSDIADEGGRGVPVLGVPADCAEEVDGD